MALLVIPRKRWPWPDMTEKLFSRMLSEKERKQKDQLCVYLAFDIYAFVFADAKSRFSHYVAHIVMISAASCKNQRFAYAKTKTQISCAVTAQLISAFVFTPRIVQSLYFLNPKFQASSHLQWLYSLVCVRLGQNPHYWLSHVAAHFQFSDRQSDAVHLNLVTLKFLNFWMQEIFAVIYMKFKQTGYILGHFVKMMQME